MPRLRFAGQITGCEGYVESAAVGLMAGRMAASEALDTVFEAITSLTVTIIALLVKDAQSPEPTTRRYQVVWVKADGL